jgi:hypothetical protein
MIQHASASTFYNTGRLGRDARKKWKHTRAHLPDGLTSTPLDNGVRVTSGIATCVN